jgi:DNA-binding response OmpR family regulator
MARPKILVVDDSRTVCVQLRRILSQAGYDVSLASCGKEGIRQARDQCPQLMILDIQMPDMDGYAVCEELQRMGKPWDALTVIFLTSVQSHALSLLGDQLGAYLRKPVNPEKLLASVAGLVGPGAKPTTNVTGDLTARAILGNASNETATS